MDKNIRYKDTSPDVPAEAARELVSLVETEKLKPWTITHRVSKNFEEFTQEDIRCKVLRPLMIHGVLTPNANGDIITYKPELLEDLIN